MNDIISEDSGGPGFAELSELVVEILCGVDVMNHSPVLLSAYKRAGEDD